MVSTSKNLWERLERYQPDEPGHQIPFSLKLANEQRWSPQFTQRAIFEYKRFVYLCCISPQGASPPPVVDQVWHLHLTYTRSYWQDFCPNVLYQELHHQPSAGGLNEQERHRDWYSETLKLYETCFNQPPPPDIWPPGADDPGPLHPEHIPRPKLPAMLLAAAVVALLPAYRLAGPAFLICYSSFLVICAALRWLYLNRITSLLRTRLFRDYPPGIVELAYLAGNRQRVRQLVIAAGIRSEAFRYKDGNWHIDQDALRRAEPFCATWFSGCDALSNEDFLEIIDAHATPYAARYQPLQAWLEDGLFLKGLVLIPIVLGGIRLFQGVMNDKPVTILFIEALLYVCVFGGMLALPRFHRHMAKLIREDPEHVARLDAEGLVGVVVLSGLSTLAQDPGFRDLDDAILGDWREIPRQVLGPGSTGSCGSSSSCSSGGDGCGSSCGGGCGGCGGGD